MSESVPSHTTWREWEMAYAVELLLEHYRKAYNKHVQLWDIERHVDSDPEYAQELQDERDGLKLLVSYWAGENWDPTTRQTTEEQRRLMRIGGESI